MYSLTQLTDNLLFNIDKNNKKYNSTFGNLQTGFPRFDFQTGGIPAGDLVLISSPQIELGRAMILSMISNNRKSEKLEIIYFSTLLSVSQITKMLICNQMKLDFLQLQKGDLTEQQLSEIEEFSKDMYVYFDDSMNLTIDNICKKLDMVESGNNKIVVLDYLNYFEKNNDHITDKLFNIKQIAREYNLPIIVLLENKPDFSEKLNISKESIITSLNFDITPVDIECHIYRPEYYGIIEDGKGKTTIGLTKMKFYYQKELLNQLDLVYKREHFLLNSIH